MLVAWGWCLVEIGFPVAPAKERDVKALGGGGEETKPCPQGSSNLSEEVRQDLWNQLRCENRAFS